MTTAASGKGSDHRRPAVVMDQPTHRDVLHDASFARTPDRGPKALAPPPTRVDPHRYPPHVSIHLRTHLVTASVRLARRRSEVRERYQLEKREVATRRRPGIRLVKSCEFRLTTHGPERRPILLHGPLSEEASSISITHEAASPGPNSAAPLVGLGPPARGPRALRGVEWGRGVGFLSSGRLARTFTLQYRVWSQNERPPVPIATQL